MSKRFFDTTIWTQNKWFRKLTPEFKSLWFYLFSNCDSVGVWEEDIEMASYIIGFDFKLEKVKIVFAKQIKIFNINKWWIKDFCSFQYGVLKVENITNKPHQSYISLLKKHSLWIDYSKTIQSLKEKEKDKEKDKEKASKITKHKYGEYKNVLLTDKQYNDLKDKIDDRNKWIKIVDESIEEKGNIYHIKNFYLAILKWYKKDNPIKLNDKKIYHWVCPDGCKDDKGLKTDMNDCYTLCSICKTPRVRK